VEERAPLSAPRPLRIAAVALAGVLLFGGFVYLGFPYDRLGPVLAERIERATGLGLDIGGVAASPDWLGPGIALTDVRVRLPDGRVQPVSRLHVRPAWSLSWLRARPALALEAESPSGSLQGVLTLGPEAAFAGQLRQLDLASLALEQLARGLALEGSADLELSLVFGQAGAEGPVSLVAREGSLAHPSLPLAIPYEEIQGEFVLGGETALRIEQLSIDSSLGQGAIDGSVGRGSRGNGAPLDLQVEIAAVPAVQAVLRAQGIQLAANGTTRFHLAGTTSRPIIR
jgi:type II secretion system protein N